MELLLRLVSFTGQLTVTNPTSEEEYVTAYAVVYTNLINCQSLGTTDMGSVTMSPGDIVILNINDSDYESMFFQIPNELSFFIDRGMIGFEIQAQTENFDVVDGEVVDCPECWITYSNLMASVDLSIEYAFTPHSISDASIMFRLDPAFVGLVGLKRRQNKVNQISTKSQPTLYNMTRL
jgi:hypothetical protein